MSLLSLVLPTIGQPDSTEDPKLNSALTAIQTWANGNVDGSNISSHFGAVMGAAGTANCTIKIGQAGGAWTAGVRNTQYSAGAGLTFTTACVAAFLAGWRTYSDAGNTVEIAPGSSSVYVFPSGNAAFVNGSNFNGFTMYPLIQVVAIGY